MTIVCQLVDHAIVCRKRNAYKPDNSNLRSTTWNPAKKTAQSWRSSLFQRRLDSDWPVASCTWWQCWSLLSSFANSLSHREMSRLKNYFQTTWLLLHGIHSLGYDKLKSNLLQKKLHTILIFVVNVTRQKSWNLLWVRVGMELCFRDNKSRHTKTHQSAIRSLRHRFPC